MSSEKWVKFNSIDTSLKVSLEGERKFTCMVCRLPHPTRISFHCLPHISRPATKRVISKQDFCQETHTAAKEELCLVVVRDTLDMAGIGIFQWWIFTCFGVVGIWYMPAIPNVESSPALAKLQKLLTPLLLPNQWPLLQTIESQRKLKQTW